MRKELPCLPLIQERFWNAIKEDIKKENKKYYSEFELTMFLQTWGSTALGFGGIGGQAMTDAYTTVIREIYSEWCGVFFGKNLAYIIKGPNTKFYEDMSKFQMKPVYEKDIYERNRKGDKKYESSKY